MENYDPFDDGSDLSEASVVDSDVEAVGSAIVGQRNIFKFQKNERVYCHHNGTLYEATIIEREMRHKYMESEDFPRYKVHYHGWNSKWDEWVTDNRLFKKTQDNAEIKRKLDADAKRKAQQEDVEKLFAEAIGDSSSDYEVEYGDNDDDHASNKQFKVSVKTTADTKAMLVDDWEFITAKLQLLPLPRPNAVIDILEDYMNYKITHETKQEATGSDSPVTEQSWRSKVLQVRNLFNEMLGRRLLYHFEKQQFAMISEKHEEKYGQLDPSLIYGAEHLMRLLVSMPDLLAEGGIVEDKAEQVRVFVQDLVQFIESRNEEYFCKQYENATPEYLRYTWEY